MRQAPAATRQRVYKSCENPNERHSSARRVPIVHRASVPMKPCILLIEDDGDMRELVGGHLEHNGFDVQRADDGIKGQALALQYIPDLIVLDLMLPRVDGLTLCQRRN